MSSITQQEFSFHLAEPGFATALYVADGIETEFELSNVCNPLTDMLDAVASLLTNPSQLWDGSHTSAFTWYSGNESYNWTLTALQDGTLQIRVTQSCEFFGDDEVEVVGGECPIDDFVACITRGLDKFIKTTGLLNYHQQWQAGEFPTTYFLILKKHLIDCGMWKRPTEKCGDVLSDEMNLLTH